MNRICWYHVGVVLLGTLYLAGCDLQTPSGAVGVAAEALKAENLQLLRTALEGPALSRYGNRDGIQILVRELGWRPLRIRETRFAGSFDFRGIKSQQFYIFIEDERMRTSERELLWLDVACVIAHNQRTCHIRDVNWD